MLDSTKQENHHTADERNVMSSHSAKLAHLIVFAYYLPENSGTSLLDSRKGTRS
jgi:hypothetical protein